MSLDDALSDQRLAFGQWAMTEKPAVLVVDDEPQLITAMTDALDEDYRVIGETSPDHALEILKADSDIQVIISDQRMPAMTGDEFLFRAREISPATRILVTAYADMSAVVNAVNRGKIFNYVRKPWDEAELRSIVDTAAQYFALGAALRQERALLKCIMDCSLDAISVKDCEHRYIRLNAAEAVMLGAATPEDINGRMHTEFLPSFRAARWSAEEEQLFETGEPLRDRIEYTTSEAGVERWYMATKVPIRSLSGIPIGLVSITRDVTENQSIEQVKDEFIYTARHELRTPLTVISSTIRLIRTGRFGAVSPATDELLKRNETNCDRLLGLINNMLDIQDIMTGRAAFQMAPVALQDVVDESVKLNEPLAAATEVHVRPCGPLELTILGDRRYLVQALGQLLSNACKFSRRGSTVHIAATNHPDRLQISVIDEGRGMPVLFAETLFRSFNALSQNADRTHRGAGLGLRLCKLIVEAHGGQIGFTPAAGVGSHFFLTLPRMEAPCLSEYPHAAANAGSSPCAGQP